MSEDICNMNTPQPRAHDVTLTRSLDAPPATVFESLTHPKHLVHWWGPEGFKNSDCEVDLQPGGAWRITMHSPEGDKFPGGGVYREIVEPRRLVFTNGAWDPDGKVLLDGLTTFKLEDVGGKTLLHLHTRAVSLVPDAEAMLRGMETGWSQSLDRLRDYTDSMPSIHEPIML